MEPLIQIKTLFTFTGLAAINHRNGNLLRNIIRCMSGFLLFTNSIGPMWYFTYGADDFLDYAMSFTAIIITTYVLFAYIAQMIRINPTLKVIDKLKRIIQQRK